MFKRLLGLAVGAALLASCSLFDPYADVDTVIKSRMDAMGAAGLQAGIVKDGKVVWTKNYGYADIASGRLVADDTIFVLDSVSKTIVGATAMGLVDQGRLDLDADVNTYLPFPVRNPHFPTVPITPRMLLSHKSSIVDNWVLLTSLYDSQYWSLPIETLTQRYLDPAAGSPWYSADANFLTTAPGTAASYSNINATLTACIIQRIAGVSFDVYSNSSILAPSGVATGSWFLTGLPADKLATPYDFNSVPATQFYAAFWPAGTYRTTALEFAKFWGMLSNDGVASDGTRVLAAGTVAKMMQSPFVDDRHCLSLEKLSVNGKTLYGHFGDAVTTRTGAYFDPDAHVGIFYLATGNFDYPYARLELLKALYQKALTY
jgi:CubicO group peptidase (beta-lactamase class C family)